MIVRVIVAKDFDHSGTQTKFVLCVDFFELLSKKTLRALSPFFIEPLTSICDKADLLGNFGIIAFLRLKKRTLLCRDGDCKACVEAYSTSLQDCGGSSRLVSVPEGGWRFLDPSAFL